MLLLRPRDLYVEQQQHGNLEDLSERGALEGGQVEFVLGCFVL